MPRFLRPPRLRALALLVQVLALFCQLAEGTGREHCPHHDLPPTAVAMAHMAGHHHHQSGGHSHGCHCLGDCTDSDVAMPAPEMAGLHQVQAPRDFVTAAPLLPLPTASQLRLPPSQGPPLSA